MVTNTTFAEVKNGTKFRDLKEDEIFVKVNEEIACFAVSSVVEVQFEPDHEVEVVV